MDFHIIDHGDGHYDVYDLRGGDGGLFLLICTIILAVFTDLFASFGLPVVAYFIYFKNCPNILIGLAQSIPMLLTCAVMQLINICLFLKYVLRLNIFENLSIGLTSVNRFVRYMLILSVLAAMICNLVPSAPNVESEMYFGATFAYNFIFAIAELVLLLKADLISGKGFFSILISFVGACVIGAIAMEIEPLKKVMFEIVVLTALIILEVCIIIFRKIYDM